MGRSTGDGGPATRASGAPGSSTGRICTVRRPSASPHTRSIVPRGVSTNHPQSCQFLPPTRSGKAPSIITSPLKIIQSHSSARKWRERAFPPSNSGQPSSSHRERIPSSFWARREINRWWEGGNRNAEVEGKGEKEVRVASRTPIVPKRMRVRGPNSPSGEI